MKLFSLESKLSLVGWSVLSGLLANTLFYYFSKVKIFDCFDLDCQREVIDYGWPFKFLPYKLNGYVPSTVKEILFYPVIRYIFILDSLFWILIVFIILSLIRYFKKKNTSMTSRQA